MPLEETPLDPSLGPWHLLGYVLRLLRHEHNESLTDVAVVLSVSFQTISNWEHARARMHVKNARILDARWQTGGLLEMHHRAAVDGQKPRQFGEFTRYERTATTMRIYGMVWVPGLLQTPDYARTALETYREPDPEGVLAQRLDRQKALARTPAPDVWIILDEAALDRPIGSSKIMHDQIKRLIELGETARISLRVVPKRAGAHQGLDGEFELMSSGGRTVAFVAAPGGGFLVQGGAQVERFMSRWEAIGVHALAWEGSKEVLMKALEAYT
jgi:uncharacterized protein DUF5753